MEVNRKCSIAKVRDTNILFQVLLMKNNGKKHTYRLKVMRTIATLPFTYTYFSILQVLLTV